MILCFTGTGNSRFVADCMGETLDDQVISLNELMRAEDWAPIFESEKPFVICFPIYAWGIPPVVRRMLEGATFAGSSDVYFVATMGANSGRTDQRCQELAAVMGLTFKGFAGVVMPDNYVVMLPPKSPEQARPVIAAGAEKARRLAAAIAAGETIAPDDKTSFAGLKSGIVNRMFTKHMGDTKDYLADEKCVACGTCVAVCPLNNVTLTNGVVTFGNDCAVCYSCVHRCPKQAIQIKGKTESKGRYVCPEYANWK